MPVTVRALRASDYDKGFLELLGQLTEVGDIPQADFEARCQELVDSPDYHVTVLEDSESGAVVAAGTLLVERKFIHGCGKVGHIEDVVVSHALRGHSLGRTIVDALVRRAEQEGCYKVILDCDESNVAFYAKCGLKTKGVQMAKYNAC